MNMNKWSLIMHMLDEFLLEKKWTMEFFSHIKDPHTAPTLIIIKAQYLNNSFHELVQGTIARLNFLMLKRCSVSQKWIFNQQKLQFKGVYDEGEVEGWVGKEIEQQLDQINVDCGTKLLNYNANQIEVMKY